MIVKDHIATIVAASTFTLILTLASSGAASAVEPDASQASGTLPVSSAREPLAVDLNDNGTHVPISTLAPTVGGLLEERNVHPAAGDYVAPAPGELLAPGMRVTYRRALPVRIRLGSQIYAVRSSAATVGDLLAERQIDVAPGDDVSPALSHSLTENSVVRVVRVSRWEAKVHQTIAPARKDRVDPRLALGTSRVIASGKPGVRETTIRFVKRDNGAPVRTVLASRILRFASAKIVVHGARTSTSLARVAALGFASAVHFAGSAMHMLASAYTAGCYGCTGMTASGRHAGYGIIAVDPRVIPLGTKLFIPGYGRAVAGDTGGAIVGHRIDLGFDTNGEAYSWGSRAVTVYLLR